MKPLSHMACTFETYIETSARSKTISSTMWSSRHVGVGRRPYGRANGRCKESNATRKRLPPRRPTKAKSGAQIPPLLWSLIRKLCSASMPLWTRSAFMCFRPRGNPSDSPDTITGEKKLNLPLLSRALRRPPNNVHQGRV